MGERREKNQFSAKLRKLSNSINANGEAGIRNWIISVFFTEVYKTGTHFWWHFFSGHKYCNYEYYTKDTFDLKIT